MYKIIINKCSSWKQETEPTQSKTPRMCHCLTLPELAFEFGKTVSLQNSLLRITQSEEKAKRCFGKFPSMLKSESRRDWRIMKGIIEEEDLPLLLPDDFIIYL